MRRIKSFLTSHKARWKDRTTGRVATRARKLVFLFDNISIFIWNFEDVGKFAPSGEVCDLRGRTWHLPGLTMNSLVKKRPFSE